MTGGDWEPSDDELAAMEQNVFTRGPDGETPVAAAKRLLDEAAISAAMSVIQLCKSGGTDRIRLEASKYVLERALGPAGKNEAGERDELLSFYEKITGVKAP